MIKAYAIKGPDGKMLISTVSRTENGAWVQLPAPWCDYPYKEECRCVPILLSEEEPQNETASGESASLPDSGAGGSEQVEIIKGFANLLHCADELLNNAEEFDFPEIK